MKKLRAVSSKKKLSTRFFSLLLIITLLLPLSSCDIKSFSKQNRYLNNLVREQTLAIQPDVQITQALSPISYEDRYGYKSLPENQKKVYDKINTAVLNYHRFIDLRDTPILYIDFLRIFYYFIDDHPEMFWVYPHIETSFYDDSARDISIGVILRYMTNESSDRFDSDSWTIGYKVSDEDITANRSEFNKKINQILALLDPKEDDLSKELKIYNYIAEHVRYDNTLKEEIENNAVTLPIMQSAYGAAIGEATVCTGFAKLFSLLTNYAGIECLIQHGELQDQGHVWNVVRIDGKYYNVDATEAIVLSKNNSFINYTFFNLTDQEIEKTHKIKPTMIEGRYQVSYDVPACYSSDKSFSTLFGIKVSGNSFNQNDFTEKIKRIHAHNLSELYFYFPEGASRGAAQTFFNTNARTMENIASGYFKMDGYYYYLEETRRAFIILNRI